ncbi:hypothetical protein OF83DRAFT_769688 [Amylostereum chailletii]|nr:hypothetical protein OF83DRAFT_769688 [Amylostereum chailletii]
MPFLTCIAQADPPTRRAKIALLRCISVPAPPSSRSPISAPPRPAHNPSFRTSGLIQSLGAPPWTRRRAELQVGGSRPSTSPDIAAFMSKNSGQDAPDAANSASPPRTGRPRSPSCHPRPRPVAIFLRRYPNRQLVSNRRRRDVPRHKHTGRPSSTCHDIDLLVCILTTITISEMPRTVQTLPPCIAGPSRRDRSSCPMAAHGRCDSTRRRNASPGLRAEPNQPSLSRVQITGGALSSNNTGRPSLITFK